MPEAYRIVLTRRAKKDLDALDAVIARRVSAAINGLLQDPRPPGCLRIVSEDGVWRIRVGDYRIAYQINDQERIITVARAGHRSEFYN